uniref:Uncharacterized protein n=1 Tax=Vibrio tasmaniensis TaxID=212663 RepID=A0A0H3ZRT2_9VIBR|nr:hypothetical protein [Vibrio tasmaniensis]
MGECSKELKRKPTIASGLFVVVILWFDCFYFNLKTMT